MKKIKMLTAIILSAVLVFTLFVPVVAVDVKSEEKPIQNIFSDMGESIVAFFQNLWSKIKSLFGKIAGLFMENKFTGGDYTIPELDLSTLPEELKGTEYEYLYKLTTVDDSGDYAAHPDSVLLNNGNILTVYPAGHGKGAVLNKISTNGGASWDERVENTPESWVNSQETPTVYRLEFADGTPDKLILISANPKWPNADTVGGFECSISEDEGKTWSEPKEAPAALNGERHKAEYLSDGRLYITFRSIERGEKARQNAKTTTDRKRGWISEGLVAWVGTYEDLKNAGEGQYRIKLAHIFEEGQKKAEYYAGADTGYCGNVVLEGDTVVTCAYGKFSPQNKTANGLELKTFICSKRVNIKDTDKLVEKLG